MNSSDYDHALQNLRRVNPIASEQFLGLTGTTRDGRFVFVPSSYRMGYQNATLPAAQRPNYTLNLGIIGQLSDGHWVFPPTYDAGLRDGSNDLRFAVLAEGEKRLFDENQGLHQEIEELRSKIQDLLNPKSR